MFILLKASQIFHKMQPQMVVSLIIILTCIMPGMQQFVDCESAGGSVEPLLCIIVPFRDGCGWHGHDRSSQLDFFLAQMTKWLTDRGHTSFRFVVSEQSQRGLFNKGLLFNIGALAAFSEGCEHLVFHDVDQLPQNTRNDYFYTGHPTHLCTWSSQYPSNWKGMRPHVGGALMMSRSDYIAVNGFANRYWRWGLEDSDMYHRIYTVLKDLVRLPQEIGNYSAIEHLRVCQDLMDLMPEWEQSDAHFKNIQNNHLDAQIELESDGLMQACHYSEVVHMKHDPSKKMMFVTSDLYEKSSCRDAKANATKLEFDQHYRRDLSMKGTCVHFLKDFGLTPAITRGRPLCTEIGDFCIQTWTNPDIRDNTDRFDQASPEKEEDRPYESGKTTVTDSELGSGQPSRPDTFPSDVFDEIGVRSMQPWMHGENHPAVSIKVGSTPLKSKCLGEMELTFHVIGTLPGSVYKISVEDVTLGTLNQWKDVWRSFGDDTVHNPVTVKMSIWNEKQDTFRFGIGVWDAYEGLTQNEAHVAQLDLTVSLSQETSGTQTCPNAVTEDDVSGSLRSQVRTKSCKGNRTRTQCKGENRTKANCIFSTQMDVPVFPLDEWNRLVGTNIIARPHKKTSHYRQMVDPYTQSHLLIRHPFMMGWNESMAYLRMLIRNRVPFSVVRYGDGELEILSNRSHHNKEWSWSPDQNHADKFRRLLTQPFQDAQSAESIMMIGLPVTFCAEGRWAHAMGGGGRRDLVQNFFQPPLATELGIGGVPSNRFLYSWQFGNLNFNATFDLIETLVTADWPILVVCNHELVMDKSPPAWVSGVLTISTDSVEGVIRSFDTFTSKIQKLARAVDGAAFLFSAGPLSNVIIAVMHRINPRNIYIDIGGSLDYFLSNVRTRDFHPLENDENHFVRAGGALVNGQNCTETRWILIQNGLTPIFSERRGYGIEGNGRNGAKVVHIMDSSPEIEYQHGDQHPSVSINFGNPGLVYQYDENGALKSMEVHAWMDGLVAGFDYQVLVQEAGGM